MELSIEQLQPLIDVLKAQNVGYFKYGTLELRFNPEPPQTSVPPPQTNDQLRAEQENMLFYSAE